MFADPSDAFVKIVIDRARKTKLPDDVPAPRTESLRELLSLSFLASSQREEGRPLRFSLAEIAPKDAEAIMGISPGWEVQRFSHPRPCTVREIAKLAPAIDTRQTIMAATRAAGVLELWALICVGTSWWRQRRGETGTSYWPKLGYIRIDAEGPGNLTIYSGSDVLASIRNGREQKIPLMVLDQNGPVWTRLSAMVNRVRPIKAPGGGDDYGYSVLDLANIVKNLVRRTQELGHGGTIVFTGGTINECSIERTKYSVSEAVPTIVRWAKTLYVADRAVSFDQIAERALGSDPTKHVPLKHLENYGQRVAANQIYMDTIERFARMTQVDGAVVFSGDLSLVGFGATLRGQVPKSYRVAGDVDALTLDDADLADDGTRHQSAARFCASQDDAVVFCVSQDGTTSCFVGDHGVVTKFAPIGFELMRSPDSIDDDPPPRITAGKAPET